MPSEPSEAGSFEEPTPFEADGSCIYSSSPPDHEAVLPLPFFQNQVAGHTGVSNEGGSILVPEPGKLAKPVGHGYFAGEDHFYRQLESYPALAEFCPAYFGTRTFGQRQFVVLEDLTHGMERPLVVDIKVGTCTVAPDAKWTKRISHLAKDRATTTRSLGLRLVGAQTALRRYGKSWGKGLQPGDMSEALRMCFSADGRLCVSALSAFVPQLQRLAQVLVDGPRWQLVSSSILFVFQADEDPLATAPHSDPPIPPCPSTPLTSSPSATPADAPAVVAQSMAQSQELWHVRENISMAQAAEGLNIKHDIALPVSAIPAFVTQTDAMLTLQWPGVRMVNFGHLGDGNLHYNVQCPIDSDAAVFLHDHEAQVNHVVFESVKAFGGSISAEHGIGRLKADTLPHYKDPVALALMRRIKQALDPHNVMNPGRVLRP